jgi:hypothetical protein
MTTTAFFSGGAGVWRYPLFDFLLSPFGGVEIF